MEFFVFSLVLDNDNRFSFVSLFYFEGPMFHVGLDNSVIEFSANESLGIEDSVVWIFGSLIFGSITDEPFSFCKGDIRRSGSVSLVIGDDFDSVILPDSDTGVSGTEIDSDSFGCVAHLL